MESCLKWLPHSESWDLLNSEDLKQIAKICLALHGKGNATRTDGPVVLSPAGLPRKVLAQHHKAEPLLHGSQTLAVLTFHCKTYL